jgi:quinol monooxygenase YgiN
MTTIMVRYKTKPDSADDNESLVRAVFAQLKTNAPDGLRYATFRLEDGVSFVHIATVDSTDDNPLVELPAFKAFQRELKQRCAEPPVITELSPIGSYGVSP